MPRPRHPDKDIEAAVAYAESKSWIYDHSNGHAWGKLYCPGRGRGDCIIHVWSTPRSGTDHARKIRKQVDRCPHKDSANV